LKNAHILGIVGLLLLTLLVVLTGGWLYYNMSRSAPNSNGKLPALDYSQLAQYRLVVLAPASDQAQTFLEAWYGEAKCPLLRVRYLVDSFGNIKEGLATSGSFIKAKHLLGYWHDRNHNCIPDSGELLNAQFEPISVAQWNNPGKDQP